MKSAEFECVKLARQHVQKQFAHYYKVMAEAEEKMMKQFKPLQEKKA